MSGSGAPIASRGYFEEIHDGSPDPFGLLERWYELRKRAISSALLARPRYRRCFEPGCSIGAFTAVLAERCDEVIAMDSATAAVTRASGYLSDLGVENATVLQGSLPGDWPAGDFDLVVLAEIGYYLGHAGLAQTIERAGAATTAGGELLAVHWRPPIENCELSGDEVHAAIAAAPGFEPLAHYDEPLFVVDLFARRADIAEASLPHP